MGDRPNRRSTFLKILSKGRGKQPTRTPLRCSSKPWVPRRARLATPATRTGSSNSSVSLLSIPNRFFRRTPGNPVLPLRILAFILFGGLVNFRVGFRVGFLEADFLEAFPASLFRARTANRLFSLFGLALVLEIFAIALGLVGSDLIASGSVFATVAVAGSAVD